MAVEASGVEMHFISAWKYSERDEGPDYENLGTYIREMEDADEDLLSLLKHNMVRAFNAKEKHMENGVPKTTSCPMRDEVHQDRSKRPPHAFMLDFDGVVNNEMRNTLDSLRNIDLGGQAMEEINQHAEEIATKYFGSQNYDNQGVVFTVRLYIPEVGTDFICVFITDIDDRKFTTASEEDVVERIKESFDDEIPKRAIYPFYDYDDESVIDEVKIWESGGNLKQYYVNAFHLEEVESTDNLVFTGLEENQTYSPEELIERGQENGLNREQAENVQIELEVAGKSINLTLSDLRDERVKIYRNAQGENHVIIKGDIDISEEDEEELEALEGVFIDQDELQEHFE